MVQVEQALDLDDYSFCEFSSLSNLDNGGNLGYWEGPGILVAETGLINIEELDPGFNEVYFVTDLGCTTPVSIEVVGFVEAEINDVQESYCYQDTTYVIDIAPSDGVFYINGVESLPEFNPAVLGPGFHEIKYVVGEGECEDRLSVFVVISDPITGFTYANDDILCPDEPTSIFVENEGGNGVVSAFWDQDLGFGKSHIIRPSETTNYSVTLTDGCSDDLELDLNISVLDSFDVDFGFGPEVCFGDSSFVELMLDQADNYNIQWNGSTNNNNLLLNDLPGSYQVSIEDMSTGCKQEYFVDIPGAEPLGAGFTLVPNQECIDLVDNEISVLNQAYGYSGGYMNFGQGDNDVDIDFGDLSDVYNNIGEFTITQFVYNEIGCTDSISRKICVENVVRFFLPNIFSPDGDGVNDILTINSLGIDEFDMAIYDRWGNVMFTSNDVNNSWDGTYHGNVAMSGVYTIVIQYIDQETGQPFLEMFDLTLVR
jgi:gliding motility-associated-like protein